MKKVEVTLPTRRWGSLTTAYPPASIRVSEDALTDGSVNVRTTENGMLRRRDGMLKYNTTPLASSISDQYEAIFSDGAHYLLAVSNGTLSASSGDGSFTTVKTGLTATANVEMALYRDRVYCGNGVDSPFVIDRTSSYGSMAAIPVTITVVDYTGLGSDSVTVGSTAKTEGVDWTAGTDNATTATSLASALSTISGVTASANGAVITVTSNTAHIIYGSDMVNLTIASVTALRTKTMGCQAPTSAPSAADGGAGLVPDGTYTYKVTFLYYDFEESNPGPASVAVSPTGGGSTVSLTAVPLGGYGVTKRYIYRDDGSDVYRWVGEIANNTATTFSDNVASGDEILLEDQGVPPIFSNLCVHEDRIWMSGVAGALPFLYYSEAGQPDVVWSTDTILCNPSDPIITPYVYSEKVMVLNRRSFGLISGSTSDTYRYQGLPGNDGCVDNRTIQVRSVGGVPSLVWLSDQAVKSFNGATLDTLSDDIEDLLRLNIQQAQNTKGSITHTTAAHFGEGAVTGGVSYTETAGSVTTQAPTYTWDTQTKWEAPTVAVPVNCATTSLVGSLQMPVAFSPTIASGTHEGTTADGTDLSLTEAVDDTGYLNADPSHQTLLYEAYDMVAYKFVVTRACKLTAFHLPIQVSSQWNIGDAYYHSNYAGGLWSDSSGEPGSIVAGFSHPNITFTDTGTVGIYHYHKGNVDWSGSIDLTPGTYWFGARRTTQTGASPTVDYLHLIPISWESTALVRRVSDSSWLTPEMTGSSGTGLGTSFGYVQTQNPSPAAGTWYSAVYDSDLFATTDDLVVNIAHTGTYPTGTSATVSVYQADSEAELEPAALGDLTPQTSASLNGNANLTFSDTKRYWRVVLVLQTADDRSVPVVGPPTMKFPTTATWISDPIDCTAGVTAYDSLTPTQTVPGGTSITITAASCATEDGTYSAYTAIGSLAVAQWVKVKAVLTSDAGNTLTPTLTNLVFNYTIEGTFTSGVIDCGTTPAGWDVFQTDSDANGGTLTFEMAPTPYSSWTTVTNGQFPTLSPNQLVKWKATFVSQAGKVPVIRSTTINWRSTDVASSRAASIFTDGSYILAAAPYNSTTNTVIMELDSEGLWRRHDGFSAGTLGYFFNEPFIGSDTDGYFYKLFEGDTDGATAITLDLRFKAFDFGNATRRKTLRKLRVTGLANGATFTPYYSVDGGATWQTMTDELGATSFTVGTDETVFVKRLVPTDGTIPTGSTIMPRLVVTGTPAGEVHELEMTVFVRNSEALNA